MVRSECSQRGRARVSMFALGGLQQILAQATSTHSAPQIAGIKHSLTPFSASAPQGVLQTYSA